MKRASGAVLLVPGASDEPSGNSPGQRQLPRGPKLAAWSAPAAAWEGTPSAASAARTRPANSP